MVGSQVTSQLGSIQQYFHARQQCKDWDSKTSVLIHIMWTRSYHPPSLQPLLWNLEASPLLSTNKARPYLLTRLVPHLVQEWYSGTLLSQTFEMQTPRFNKYFAQVRITFPLTAIHYNPWNADTPLPHEVDGFYSPTTTWSVQSSLHQQLDIILSEARLYLRSIFRCHLHQPEVGLISVRYHYQTGRHESSSCY